MKNMAINPSETDSRMANEKEAENWLGPMREATHEELQSVEDYVKSISVNTGVKFFDS